MLTKQFASTKSLVVIFVWVVVFILTGCASMVSTKEELQSMSENEGIVFGSFLINVEKGEENESGWAFLKGEKAGDAGYDVWWFKNSDMRGFSMI